MKSRRRKLKMETFIHPDVPIPALRFKKYKSVRPVHKKFREIDLK
jgi:hypothetical protein